jgi:TPR repeat protein
MRTIIKFGALSALGFAMLTANNAYADCITEMQQANWRMAIEKCETEAAEPNAGQAQYFMGILKSAQFDESFTIDYKMSFNYFQKSANNGYTPAYYALSDAYYHAVGVEENPQQAFYWANKSAHSGDADGAVTLSYFYHSGYGTEPSDNNAKFWLMIARIKIDDFDQQTQSYFDTLIAEMPQTERVKLWDSAMLCIKTQYQNCLN